MVSRGGEGSFPDCWVAYGATDPELRAYGAERALATRQAWWVAAVQSGLAALFLALVISSAPPAVRGTAAVALLAALASSAVSLARLLATVRALAIAPDQLRLRRGLGPPQAVAWAQLGEIGLVEMPARRAVGLRLRSPAASSLPAALAGFQRRVSSGFDFLLFPPDGDCELLGRVLLRYCIDPKARQRLPNDRA